MKLVPSTGKAITGVACAFLLLGVVAEVFALFGNWWTDTHIHNEGAGPTKVANIEVSLWKVHVLSRYGRFKDISLQWEEYCGPEWVNNESWCHKIRAVRATTILAAVFGTFALVSFALAILRDSCWGARAILCTFVSMACSVCAFSISSFYATSSRPAVDEPGAAFLAMCFGTLMSLIAIIMSLFSMQFTTGLKSMSSAVFEPLASTEKPAPQILRAPCSRICVSAAAGLIFVSAAMETIAIFGPWWRDTHVHMDTSGEVAQTLVGEIDVTLWKVNVHSKYGKFKDIVLDWQEYCGPQYVNNESWCHKIRAVRGTTISAVGLGFLSLVPLALAVALKDGKCAACAVLANFLSVGCAVSAFGVSLFFPNSTRPAVDQPGIGFILVCVGALLSFVATLLASYGLWFNANADVQESRLAPPFKNSADKSSSPPVTPYGSETTTCVGSSPPATPIGSTYNSEADDWDAEQGNVVYPTAI